ncbi:MAG: CoA transferase [Nitrospiraceae bacterium]|nr:CoA transferase [Nitrospiraceae bacterium]
MSGEPAGGGRGPLDGVVVADFSRVLAGPYCTMLLGDLGADIIKVESPGGDDTRNWKPPVRDGISTYYLGVNRNKRSVVLDLTSGEDRKLAQELVRRADVMVENFKPGSLAKFDLDYDSAIALNPGLVYASITGFGSGKGASVPGYDLMAEAVSGFMSLTGDPDGEPYKAGVAVFDVIAGLHTAIGVVAALVARSKGAPGQHIEVNLLSTALSGMANQTSAYLAGGVVPFRSGNAHPSVYPYEPLATSDGEIVVAVGNDGQFRHLCEVIGAPELADDPRFAHNQDRTRHSDVLRPLLVERLKLRTKAEWFEDLLAAGVPCGPINTIDQGIAFAEQLGLDPVVHLPFDGGELGTMRNPIGFSGTSPTYRLAPPRLGEHSDEIRSWLHRPVS